MEQAIAAEMVVEWQKYKPCTRSTVTGPVNHVPGCSPYRRQKAGYSNTNAENISNRPTSINQDKNHFPGVEMNA